MADLNQYDESHRNLKPLWQRMLVIVVIFSIPVGVLVYVLVRLSAGW